MNDYPKIRRALENFGEEAFIKEAENLLRKNPKCRIVLGLFGGASRGRYGFAHSAGKKYPRPAVRYVRDSGIVGIKRHSGPYLSIALPTKQLDKK